MECIYYEEMDGVSSEIRFDDSSQLRLIKHLRALRLKVGKDVLLSNGRGLIAYCVLRSSDRYGYVMECIKYIESLGELHSRLGLAIGILNDRERFEFVLEKAVELGASDFYPLITKFTEKDKINYTRLKNKAIAALEQSKRAFLINIHQPIDINKNLDLLDNYENVILADETGDFPEKTGKLTSTLCIVGPEGGFDNEELRFTKDLNNFVRWNLGNRRLRAETAAVAILSLASMKIK